MTSVNLIRAAVKEIIMIIGGMIHPAFTILIISEIAGTVLGVGRQSKTLREQIGTLKINTDWATIKRVGYKHRRQALFSTPALFANNFSYSSVNLFIDNIFGTAVLGLYSISYRLLGLPLTIVSSNVSRIYFEEASRENEKSGNYYSLFLRTFILMLAIAIPMTIVLMIFAPSVCAFVFGEQYYMAGIFIRYLAPMFGIRFIISPLSVGLIVSEKQQYDFIFQLAFVFLSVIAFCITVKLGLGIEKYLTVLSCFYSVVYIVFFFLLFYYSKGGKR